MLETIMRRLTTSMLTAGLVLMSWATCASGTMTMSEMACCTESRDGCEMADMVESFCETSQNADVEMLEPERADDAAAATTWQSILANVHVPFTPSLLAESGVESRGLLSDSRTRPPLAHTVLLI